MKERKKKRKKEKERKKTWGKERKKKKERKKTYIYSPTSSIGKLNTLATFENIQSIIIAK